MRIAWSPLASEAIPFATKSGLSVLRAAAACAVRAWECERCEKEAALPSGGSGPQGAYINIAGLPHAWPKLQGRFGVRVPVGVVLSGEPPGESLGGLARANSAEHVYWPQNGGFRKWFGLVSFGMGGVPGDSGAQQLRDAEFRNFVNFGILGIPSFGQRSAPRRRSPRHPKGI